jgi:group I intron endonuclease
MAAPKSKPYGVIYLVTCKVNGKKYVGQTKFTLKKRWGEHLKKTKSGCQLYFHNAIRKYGVGNFSCLELEVCQSENLNAAESKWIAYYDCQYPNGYNLTSGGEVFTFSPEVVARISSSLVRFYAEHPEAKEAVSVRLQKIFSESQARQDQSRRITKFFLEHPEAKVSLSNSLIRFHEEHPEAGLEQSRKLTHFWSNSRVRRNHSTKLLKYNASHPDKRGRHSEVMRKICSDSTYRSRLSLISLQYNTSHPEKGHNHSVVMREIGTSLSYKRKQSKAQKKSYLEHPERHKVAKDSLDRGRETRWGQHRLEQASKLAAVRAAVESRGSTTLVEISTEFGVSLRTIARIKDGTHWVCHR